jgi:hypothetical protein
MIKYGEGLKMPTLLQMLQVTSKAQQEMYTDNYISHGSISAQSFLIQLRIDLLNSNLTFSQIHNCNS